MTISIDKSIFEVIKKLMGEFKTEIDSLGQSYLNYCDSAEVGRYREDVAGEMKKNKAAEVKNDMQRVRDRYGRLIDQQVEFITKEFDEWSAEAPDQNFLGNLAAIKTCGIKPTRAELESFLRNSGGSYWSYRALEQLANEAGFTFKYPKLETLERELDRMKIDLHGSLERYYGNCDNGTRVLEIAGSRENLSFGGGPISYYDCKPFWEYSGAWNYMERGSFDEQAKFLLDNVSAVQFDAQPLLDILDGKTGENEASGA